MRRIFILLILIGFLPAALTAESALIDVTQYRATVRFHIAQKLLEGDAEITMINAARGDLQEVDLDLVTMTIDAVEVGGSAATYRYDDHLLTVELASPLAPGDSVTVRVVYHGSPGNEGSPLPWGGCHWGDVTYFMGVGFLAPSVSMMRNWLPSNDIPSDKARFDVTFEVPEGQTCAGTGLLQDRSVTGDGFTAFRWVETHPTATYLFTYAISDYAVVRDDWNGIPMEYYVPRTDSARAVGYFDTVPSMMEAFTTTFGPYPFDKVGYCITPIGSMEHQTMISYAAQLFTGLNKAGSTAAHELAHMWWGDMVTCRDFSDAWLNEGFAVFSEMLYDEYLGGETAYLDNLHSTAQRYRVTDARNEGVFPLHDFPRSLPSSNYPATIYNKGGAVLAMLRDVMGDGAFFDGLRAYGQRFAYGSATSQDFEDVMEEYHGDALDWFFDEWVYAAGWPQYIAQRVTGDGSDPLRVQLLQQQDTTQFPLFAMPMDVAVVTNADDTLRRRIETGALAFQEITFSGIPSDDVRTVLFDPRGIVLKTLSYRTVDVQAAEPPAADTPKLGAVYPNPLSASGDAALVIPVSAAASAHAFVAVYDMLGRQASVLHDGRLQDGMNLLRLEAGILPRGMYMVTLRSGASLQVEKLIVE